MAQGVVIRFKADSTEYDARLKRSIEQMKSMEDQAKKLQGSIDRTDEGYIRFVQSLGKMETVAKSSKTALREYSEAILYLQQQYKTLSDAEKSGDVGKAMAASIQQLKVRAAEAQDTIGDLNEELKHMASDTAFTDGLNMMTRTIGASASAIVAWTGDSKEMEEVIKDLAKIGTTVAAVDQLTKAFQKQNLVLLKNPYVAAAAAVVALGVAIGKLVKKSQELSAVDKALQDVQQKGRDDSAKEITRIDTLNNILHDNTRSLEERKTALAEIQNLVPDYHGALTEEGNLINDNTGALQGYIDGLQRAALAQAAFDRMVEINKQKLEKQVELKDATQKSEKASKSYEEYRNSSYTSNTGSSGVGGGAIGSQLATEAVAARKAVNDIQTQIDEYDKEMKALQDLVNANDIGTDAGKTKTKGGGIATTKANEPVAGSIAAQEVKVAELTKKWKEAADDPSRQIIKAELDEANRILTEMTGKVESSSITTAADMWKDYTDKLKDVKDRLAEFQAMIKDQSLTDAQRDWAQGMAESYQEQLDKMTGATEEAANNISNSLDKIPTKFELIQQSLDKMSTGVGAISTLGNSFNELKSIGDDLADAFSGEMDAWDALMTVFNSGIGIMETVIGVMEAINTLQELSSTLSKKKVTDQATETAAVVSGKMAESTANIQEAGTSMLSAGANTAESSTAAGKAVANIPIVGPILAVAAIAAVLGAAIGAMSKAKSAGHFSGGGMILGNSYSGDNLTANVNSGELILNRAQQSNIAGQLQNNNPLGNLQLTSKVRGSDLLIVLDNTNSSRGGQRGMYVNVR